MNLNPLKLILCVFIPMLYFVQDGWSTTGTTKNLENTNYTCTMTTTISPIGIECGKNTGSIEVKITGGKAPYLIEWDNSNNSIWAEITTHQTTYTIPNLPRGNYLIKVMDATGCIVKTNTSLEDKGSGLTYTVTPNDPCSILGTMDIKVAGSSPPYTLIIEGSSTTILTAPSNEFRVINLVSGTYKVVIEKDGCRHSKQVNIVTSPGTLAVNIGTVDGNICDSYGDVQVDIAGGFSEYLISYAGPINGSYRTTGSTSIQNLPPGDYYFTIRDAYFCEVTKTVTVEASGTDMICTLSQTPANCDNNGQIGVAISGGQPGYTVAYSGPVSGSISANSRNGSSGDASIQNLLPGLYTITVTDSRGCTATESITVGGEITDLACILTQTPVLCDNMGQIGVSISGGYPAYRVDYSGPISGSIIATTSAERAGLASILDLPAGTYTIVVIDSRGCTASEDITVGGTITDLSSIVTQTPVQCDNMGQIGVSISGGAPTYRVDYSGPSNGSVIATTTAEKAGTASITGLSSGDYTIVVTDSRGCSDTKSITVGGEITDLACILTQTPVLCDNMGQIGVSISGGYPAYRVDYSGPRTGSVIATTSAAHAGLASILDLPSGTYTIVVTDSRGCSATESITVGGTITDLSSIVTQTPVQCDNMGQIGVSISGGDPSYRVDYSGPKTGYVIATTTAAKAGVASILDAPAGTYTIVVTDSRGCSDTKSITVGGSLTDLACIVSQTPQICNTMGSINIAISGGSPTYRVDYSGPQTGSAIATTTGDRSATATLSNLSPGFYTVVVTDSRGCSATETITVGSTGSDLSCDVAVNPQICESNSGIDVIIGGGTPGYSIAYSGPVSGTVASNGGSQFIPLPIGTYTVIVTDANGCTATETAVVGQGVNDLHCRLVQTHAICEKLGSIEVIISGGKPGFTVKWKTGHGEETGYSSGYNFTFEVPCPGIYEVTIIDANGCVVMEATEVRQLENNLAFELTPNSGVQEGNGYLQVSFQNGKAPYSIDLTGPVSQKRGTFGPIVLSNLPSGYYSVVVTDANGCTKQQYVTIPEVDEFVPDGMRIGTEAENPVSEELDLENSNALSTENVEESKWIFENRQSSNEFKVFQNYPNPFRSNTTLSFNLPRAMKATLLIHNHLGRQISVIEKDFEKGYNEYDYQQENIGSGVFYFSIIAGKESKSIRMLHID